MKKILTTFISLLFTVTAFAQGGIYNNNKFHQIDELLPTPNEYRTGSGAPGNKYWQQRADYVIRVELNDDNQSVTGSETITYYNNSPDVLTYLWMQLDMNIYDPESDANTTRTTTQISNMAFNAFDAMVSKRADYSYEIRGVKDASGKPLAYTINKTMMRIELPTPLRPGQRFVFSVDWFNFINNQRTTGGRGGYEYFPADGNYLYEMAHWFPRMCVYDDVNGWQNKQFLGNGEFALPFGDYKVSITVPADHIVTATGELVNASQVLKPSWLQRYNQSKTANKPVIIVTQEEAIEAEKGKATTKKTWTFDAKNVRDFAWASSRKFIWDSWGVPIGGRTVMAMSFYPKEGNPLWERYSTHAIAQTLKTYSRVAFDYPYPVAISVNGPVGGMEYPMICFNGPRPLPDGTYTAATKYGLISVIIHEVGHFWFPMIVNSDERQWTWMDEGLNTFLQYITEQDWEENYPSRRGEARNIVGYMASDKSVLEPIMSNSELIIQFGNNAYAKPATALNILRETIMGRELFDYALKEFSNRWKFKHPMPADFFRTMEDASGVDLDWFWRGWFYGTDAVDIAITNVARFRVDTQNPDIEKMARQKQRDAEPLSISEQRNKIDIPQYTVDKYPELIDFYNTYDPLAITENDRKRYQEYYNSLTASEKELLEAGLNLYVLDFENIGGLVMPLIVQMEFVDGSSEIVRIPAEIWRKDNNKVSRLFVTKKEVKHFILDPLQETADINLKNNSYPPKMTESQFQLFKQRQQPAQPNLMQLQRDGRL